MHDVSIIIPCFNKVDYTVRCLESLVANTPADRYEVVLVDNASADATPELCASLGGDVVVIRNEVNLGFAKACNQGAAAATGRHLLFLNNDTEARPGWLEPLLDLLDGDPTIGAVGSKLLFPDGTIQHAGVTTTETPTLSVMGSHVHYQAPADAPAANVRTDYDVVTGACVLFRREVFEAAGGFDEGFWNGAEDVDLCLAVRAEGWRIVYEPRSVLVHHESVSGPERWAKVSENEVRLSDKWRGRFTPTWLVTEHGVSRPHPGRHRTEIVVAPVPPGADADPAAVARTVRAARTALRATDAVCVDPSLAPAIPGEIERVRVGLPDRSADFQILVAPGMELTARTADLLLAPFRIGDVLASGPSFADGHGAQSVRRWWPDAPADPDALEAFLTAQNDQMHGVHELDPRCIARRLDTDRGAAVVVPTAHIRSGAASVARTA